MFGDFFYCAGDDVRGQRIVFWLNLDSRHIFFSPRQNIRVLLVGEFCCFVKIKILLIFSKKGNSQPKRMTQPRQTSVDRSCSYYVPVFNLSHSKHRCSKECFYLLRCAVAFVWGYLACMIIVFAGTAFYQSGIFKDNPSQLVFEMALVIAICVACAYYTDYVLVYMENKTDIMYAESRKDTNRLASKLDELSEKLDKILSDKSACYSSQLQDQTVFLKDIRHLSVKSCSKATHSSETRTPSAIDMSPIVPEVIFNSLTDNKLETGDLKSSLTDDHPCDQRQLAEEDFVDVDLPTPNSSSYCSIN